MCDPDHTQPNAQQRVEITTQDLPLHCPMPGQRLWDSHPKIYLPMRNGEQQICPYCSTVYILREPSNTPK